MKEKKADRITAVGVLQIIGGVLLILLFGAIFFISSVFVTISGEASSGGGLMFLISVIIGAILIWRGYSNYKLASRFRRVSRALADKAYISLIDLERKLLWYRPKLLKALRKQTKHGFWPDSYIDTKSEIFMIENSPVYVSADSGDHALDEVLGTANDSINEMMAIGRFIQDAELKAKVENLAGIAGQIYTYVGKHPDKADPIRRLSNYFLPTTVTLLDKYVELQNQPIKTDNMTGAMRKIEDVMSTLEDVFKNRLDALYGLKAMDVDVEIEVLQTMAEM